MFSLILSVLSIALTACLTTLALYDGGQVYDAATTKISSIKTANTVQAEELSQLNPGGVGGTEYLVTYQTVAGPVYAVTTSSSFCKASTKIVCQVLRS